MIVCADDFGMAPDINGAILELAELGKVSAVSVMAALPGLDTKAVSQLSSLGDKVDIGLHLVFSECQALSTKEQLPPFGDMMRKCWLGGYRAESAMEEIKAQYDAFVQAAGREPDFIDGHMHTHQFPGIREGLAAFVKSLPYGQNPYVRNTHLPADRIFSMGINRLKTLFISLPGGAMKKLLREEGILTNYGFSGVYEFSNHDRYPEYLDKFLGASASPSSLLMLHPGREEGWRASEYESLMAREDLAAMVNRFPAKKEED